MNDYIEVRAGLNPCSEDATDILAALLAEEGYESFVPDTDGLTAYVKAELFDKEAFARVTGAFPFSDTVIDVKWHLVEGRDWNAEWERHYFKPIVIEGRCAVHSSFHTGVPVAEYDIVIDPKMAFGTGHHQTTTLIIRRLLELGLEGKSVIDMGTGTGILAILAAMRGATRVDAVEIDPFAHANAVENTALNGHPEINTVLGDATALESLVPADLLLANINRNIITADLPAYVTRVVEGGRVLLSGFYTDDIPVVLEAAAPLGLREAGRYEQDRWAAIELIKEK